MLIGQSWTDPFSNHTSITGIDVGSHLEELVGVGTTPTDVLLPLMHEATHHWTFRSPVGNTLAFLNSRTRRKALQVLDGREEQQRLFLLDFLSSQVTTELLRPLAEGIALAAECDALNRKSTFISGPFLAAARAFAPSSDPVLTAMPLNAALLQARKSWRGISRKLNIYAGSLDASGSGYLLGYLSMRSMMRHLWLASRRLVEEGDLCVSFIRSYIYSDWQLVDLLLERDVSEISLVQRISEYISNRLWDINQITDADIRRFEELASADTEDWGTEYSKCLHFDASSAARGHNRGQELLEELFDPITVNASQLEDYAELAPVLEREILESRAMVYLGTCDVEIEIIDQKCRVTRDGTTLLEDIPTHANEGRRRGELDLFYDAASNDCRRLIHISADGSVAVVERGLTAGTAKPTHFNPSLSRADLRQASALIDRMVPEAISSTTMHFYVDHVMKQVPDVLQGLYLDVALRFAKENYRQHVKDVLTEGGIRALLHGDRDLSEALILAGIISQSAPLRAFIDGSLISEGLDPTLFDELLEISQTGLELALTDGKFAVTFV
jgi:hypothetical protein